MSVCSSSAWASVHTPTEPQFLHLWHGAERPWPCQPVRHLMLEKFPNTQPQQRPTSESWKPGQPGEDQEERALSISSSMKSSGLHLLGWSHVVW